MKRVVLVLLFFTLVLWACPRENKSEPAAPWRAVIAYIDDPNQATEDWSFYSDSIAQKCRGDRVVFAWADASDTKVELRVGDVELAVVDVSDHVKDRANVWLLVQPGPSVQPLQYEPGNVDAAIEFCRGGTSNRL